MGGAVLGSGFSSSGGELGLCSKDCLGDTLGVALAAA